MSDLADKVDRAQRGEVERAPARQPQTIDVVARKLRDAEQQFAAALPSSIPAQQFVRILVTEVRRNPKLAKCKPDSLLGAAMLCAQHGLSPGPLGHVFLVPRGSEVTFQLGYKGMIELATRSGIAIEGHTVREGDEFEVEFGTGGFIRHRPRFDGSQLGSAYAWWAIGKHVDGREWREALGRPQVEHYRSKSQTPNAGAWQTDYDAMALKTVVRRLATFLPMTGTAASAVAADGATAKFEPSTSELSVQYEHEDVTDVDEVDDEPAADANGEAVTS